MTVSTISASRSSVLRRHHVVALAVCVPLVALLAVDWLVTGLTGERTAITDDARASTGFSILMTGWLSLAFVTLFFVIRAEAPRFAQLGRVAQWCRRALLVGCPLMAVGNGIIYPLLQVLDVEEGAVLTISDSMAGLGLALTFLPALAIGLTQAKTNRLGLGGRLLSLGVPAILLTGAVALVAEDWASPVLLTMSVLVGLSTLGVRAADVDRGVTSSREAGHGTSSGKPRSALTESLPVRASESE